MSLSWDRSQLWDPSVHNNYVSTLASHGLVPSPWGWLERGVLVDTQSYRYCLHKCLGTPAKKVELCSDHIQLGNITRKGMMTSHQPVPWLLFFTGTRHNPSWGVKEGLRGLWKAPVNHLSLYCSYFHLPKTGTKQQVSVLLRKCHTLIRNGSLRLPSIIPNSGFALSLLNSSIPMKSKHSF